MSVLVDWSYAYDPLAYIKSKGNDGDWFDILHGDNSNFINFKIRHPEFAPDNAFFGRDYYDGFDICQNIMYEKNTGRILGKALSGRYSVYDVLDPAAGEIKYVPKPERSIHPLSPMRPLIAYQACNILCGLLPTGFMQFDNMLISRADVSPENVDLVIRTHNLALPSTEVTGQIDTLHPPGYSTSDVTGVSDVPYIMSWEKQEEATYKLKWSNGKEEKVSAQNIDGVLKNKAISLADTVSVERVSYEENGYANTSTINAIPLATASSVNVLAKSSKVGHEPWRAFNSDETDGWLSADGDTSNVWLIYDFGSSGAVLNKWRFRAHPTVPNTSPKRFIIEGSNSLSLAVWDVLCGTFASSYHKPLSPGEWSDWIPFTNGTSYQFYRFYILESYANG